MYTTFGNKNVCKTYCIKSYKAFLRSSLLDFPQPAHATLRRRLMSPWYYSPAACPHYIDTNNITQIHKYTNTKITIQGSPLPAAAMYCIYSQHRTISCPLPTTTASTALHCTALHCTALHCTALQRGGVRPASQPIGCIG
jgi:hypothetical protein